LSSRSSLNQNDGHNETSSAGAHSLAEILSQPACWTDCLTGLDETGKLQAVRDRFAEETEWLFIGCGSSYYVALSAVATMTALTALPGRAVPASELLLYPDLVLRTRTSCVPVLISRSGRTSEVLKAAELLKSRNIPALAISCTKDQPLEKLAEITIVLPWASEQSTVMTRSFSSMLLTLQALAATLAGDSGFSDCLRKMPGAAAASFRSLPPKIREFVSAHRFTDYVCLGQGPFYGLACESALKVTEMSVSYAQSFHTLEFRHGPKSIVSPETLLIFLLSESAVEAECEVLEEVKSLGGATLVIANKASARVRAAADLLVELSLEVPELARLAAYLFPVQLLGLYTGLSKGLDPDSPRNLSRVVILDKKDSSQEPEHAAF
jgi:glutamine---fructose-6-phosphate transaminase (isomerizing)